MLNKFRQFLESRPAGDDIEIQDMTETTIAFTYKGLYYLFINEGVDPFYIRLVLPTILKVEDADTEKILNLINEMNLKYKVAKMTIFKDSTVWIFIEQFVYAEENLAKLFDRILVIPEKIVKDFKERNKPNN